MKIQTQIFGEIDINEDKILEFHNGIIGFPEDTKFTLVYDEETDNRTILWLQSLENPEVSFPVIDPLFACPSYNPVIEDELLKPLGEMKAEHVFVLSVLTVPSEVEKMSMNLKAPIIINSDTKKACQILLDDDSYELKYPLYDRLKKLSEREEK